MKVIAVIGANFGDEGKGRIVDCLASKSESPTVIVRYNGGAQAGHTVCANGIECIFSHFGSGTLADADTYLSEYFIGNPFLYARELKELANKGVIANVSYHPYMPLSTPYDMLINREVESWRANNRHGSCGYGVAETVERLCNTNYKTFINVAIRNRSSFEDVIQNIGNKYVDKRLLALGIRNPTNWFKTSIECNGLLAQYYNDLEILIKSAKRKGTKSLLDYNTIIFEGSQGLCLDERHRFFPYVTRSKTGLTNIESICNKLGIKSIEVIYVTRAYLTRHGAGPFPTEDKDLIYEDKTNIENEWQGRLRFGHLDIDLLAESIKSDMKKCSLKVIPSVAITCFDQVPDKVKVKCKLQLREIDKNALPKMVSSMTGINKIMISRTRERK